MQVCSTSSSTSGCLSTRYVHNGVSYPCTSCSSCDGAWGNAYVACMDAKYGCDDLEYCCGQFPAQSHLKQIVHFARKLIYVLRATRLTGCRVLTAATRCVRRNFAQARRRQR